MSLIDASAEQDRREPRAHDEIRRPVEPAPVSATWMSLSTLRTPRRQATRVASSLVSGDDTGRRAARVLHDGVLGAEELIDCLRAGVQRVLMTRSSIALPKLRS